MLTFKVHKKYCSVLALLAGFVIILSSIGFSSQALANEPAVMSSQISHTLQNKNQHEKIEWQAYSQGMATWLFLDVYQASLFVDKHANFKDDDSQKLQQTLLADSTPLKLKLCYAREVTPSQFIEGANHVLPKNISPLLKEQVDALHSRYQTVQKGDCYELVYTPNNLQTELRLNNKPVFDTQVKGFKALYFGVWLGDNPLSESLKASLLKNK